jgi:hypothetical protein
VRNDVVDVLGLLTRHALRERQRFRPHGFHALLGATKRVARRLLIAIGDAACRGRSLGERRTVLRGERLILCRLHLLHPPIVRRIEQHRLWLEDVVHEHENADEEHARLQWNLPVRADQERAPCLRNRLRRQEPLNLALIRPEVRHHEERSSNHPRPERVAVGDIEPEIERTETADRSGDSQCIVRADGKLHQHHDDHGGDRGDDEDHLLHVGPRHRLHAA